MELRDLFFLGSSKKDFNKEIKESINLREVPSSGGGGGKTTQITSSNIKSLWVKAVGFSGENSSGDFEAPEYDLSEIKDACSADSYIAIAIQKYSQLIFKAGYSIVSDNDKAAEYIRQRMRYMSFATKTPMDILFQGIAEDLVKYSNAFLIKSRVDNAQLGGIQAQGVFDTKPVGGYFRVDPSTIKVKRDKNGVIKNYQQEVGNNNKSFKDVDVVHFYVDKDGNSEGMEAYGIEDFYATLKWLHSDEIKATDISIYKRGKDFENDPVSSDAVFIGNKNNIYFKIHNIH